VDDIGEARVYNFVSWDAPGKYQSTETCIVTVDYLEYNAIKALLSSKCKEAKSD